MLQDSSKSGTAKENNWSEKSKNKGQRYTYAVQLPNVLSVFWSMANTQCLNLTNLTNYHSLIFKKHAPFKWVIMSVSSPIRLFLKYQTLMLQASTVLTIEIS